MKKTYQPIAKLLKLFMLEELGIFNFTETERLIKKRLDLASMCRHENKYLHCVPKKTVPENEFTITLEALKIMS